jgi:hypothetical protein
LGRVWHIGQVVNDTGLDEGVGAGNTIYREPLFHALIQRRLNQVLQLSLKEILR